MNHFYLYYSYLLGFYQFHIMVKRRSRIPKGGKALLRKVWGSNIKGMRRDLRTSHKIVKLKTWRKNPKKYDYSGFDTRKRYVARFRKGKGYLIGQRKKPGPKKGYKKKK